MLRVEYNVRAYNVVPGMIRLAYVPFVPLVASLKISTSSSSDQRSVRCIIINSRLISDTSPLFYFIYSSIPGLNSSILPRNKSCLV